MAMENLQVDPVKLRQEALHYDAAADACAAARAEHPKTVAATQSWGPLFYESRRAAIESVNAREAALIREEQKNRAMAAQLRLSATRYESADEAGRRKMTVRDA